MSSLYHIMIMLFIAQVPMLSQEKRSTCEFFKIVNNKIIIPATVNGESAHFFLSTGSLSEIYRSEQVDESGELLIRNNLADVNINLRKSKPPPPLQICPMTDQNILGIYGADLLKLYDAVVINFDSSELCVIGESMVPSIVSDGNYREVASTFKRGIVEIALSIKWKDYHFSLDTNYDGALIMPLHPKNSFLKDPHEAWTDDELNTSPSQYIFHNKGVWMDRTGYNTSITVVKDKVSARVGMDFIKGFNWVIDYRSQKVFYKKNLVSLAAESNLTLYKVTLTAEGLQIAARNSSLNHLKVGSYIRYVNGNEVKPQEICTYYDILRRQNSSELYNIITSAN